MCEKTSIVGIKSKNRQGYIRSSSRDNIAVRIILIITKINFIHFDARF